MRTRILALSTLLLIVSAVTIDGRQAGRRDLRTEPLRGTGAIAGFVVDEASGQPLRRVEVTLIATDQAQRHVSYTDAAGSFTFPNLPPGRYSLAASKPGWLRAAYGARRHDRRGTPIHLAAGQALTNVRLGTNKGGVITGQILDETGLPAFGVQVRALEYRTVLGERRLAPVAGMTGALFGETTDDRGTFRLYGLPPGDYVVVATPRLSSNVELVAMTDAEIRAALQAAQQPPQPAATVGAHTTAREPAARRDDGVTVGFAPVYYPGTTAVSSASAVTLGVGEERGSVDFQLQLVRTGRIEGLVVPPPGAPPQGVQVMLMPETEAGGIGLMGMSILNRATPDAEGRFTFRSVVPGRYVLSARAVQGAPGAAPAPAPARTMVLQASGGGAPMMMGAGGSDRPAFWASSDITMSGENIDNQVLSLQPAMTMSGTVQFAGKASAPSDLTGVRLRIVPAPSAGQQVIMGMPSVQVTADGTFTASNLTPGRYQILGTVPTPRESFTPVNWRLQSAIVDGRDVLDFPFEINPNQNLGNVVVTFSDVTQGVSGALQDSSGRPAPDYTIVVFAADSAYWLPNARRIRTARPGTDGRFSLDNLPPGDYRMAAVVDMADGEAYDPAFLEQLVPASFAFALAPGEHKVQDMRIAGGGP